MSDNLPSITPKVELTALGKQFPIIDPDSADEIKAILEANIGPRGLTPQQLERIKAPTGGGTMWTVTGIDGEEALKVLRGIPLAWSDGRMYYRVPFAERGKTKTPPDCSSKDGFWGVGDPGGECRNCPMAQWGSDPKGGRGQACREIRRILFLRGDHILPELVTVPATSLKNARDYFLRLASRRIPYWGLITNLGLEKTSNADGIDYARITFTSGERFNQAELEALAPYHKQMDTLLHDLEIDTTDFEETHEEGE